MTKKIAIIGAGMAGLTLAHHLSDHAEITIFEKSRGIGGRMCVLYTDTYQFDHGAQFFTARSKAFQKFINPFIADKTVCEWNPKVITLEKGKKPYKRDWFEPHYVAAPKMNSLCKVMATDKNIHLNTQISDMAKTNQGWILTTIDNSDYGPYDWVVSTAPAIQTRTLFPANFVHMDALNNIKMQGCYSLMIGMPNTPTIHWDVAKVKNSPISWISVDSRKPNRDCGFSLLIQTDNEWSENHLEHDQEDIKTLLLKEISDLLDISFKDADYTNLHRWRHAKTVTSEDEENDVPLYYKDTEQQIAACGDWCIKGIVESAFLSAHALAEKLKPIT